ncbi:MAG: HlyD family efflux transporter periplasmic adaptor subunit [Calditrichaeota bacterium]|nr:HlyD family efflux transporter periplasmic adaptor subunit [Calditrichota bacterium]
MEAHTSKRGAIVVIGLALLLALGCKSEDVGSFSGYVEAEFVDVATSQAGRLDSVVTPKGTVASSGSPLFYLEATVERAGVEQVREQLQAAEATLADIRQGRRPQETAVIKAQLDQALANESLLLATLKRTEAVFQSGGVSSEEYDLARTQAELATAKVRELRSQLEVAKLPAREDQLRAQAAQIQSLRASLEQSEWRLSQKAVNVPEGGLVYDVLYQVGEWVSPGMPVIRLLPEKNMKVRFFIPESRLGDLQVGTAVSISLDGRATPVAGKISYISRTAEYTPPIIYSNETRSKLVFMAEAVPDDPTSAALNVGQPVSVMLQ